MAPNDTRHMQAKNWGKSVEGVQISPGRYIQIVVHITPENGGFRCVKKHPNLRGRMSSNVFWPLNCFPFLQKRVNLLSWLDRT
jgi:hypothetical protein